MWPMSSAPASRHSPPAPVTVSAMRAPSRASRPHRPAMPVADEQEARQAGELPEQHQQHQVVGQHHAQHGTHEQQQEDKEALGLRGSFGSRYQAAYSTTSAPMPVISSTNSQARPSSRKPKSSPSAGNHSTASASTCAAKNGRCRLQHEHRTGQGHCAGQPACKRRGAGGWLATRVRPTRAERPAEQAHRLTAPGQRPAGESASPPGSPPSAAPQNSS